MTQIYKLTLKTNWVSSNAYKYSSITPHLDTHPTHSSSSLWRFFQSEIANHLLTHPSRRERIQEGQKFVLDQPFTSIDFLEIGHSLTWHFGLFLEAEFFSTQIEDF